MALRRERKKHLGLLYQVVILLSIAVIFTGCKTGTQNYNNALNDLGIKEVERNTLAVIINNPTDDQLAKISNLNTVEYDKTKSSLLIIPVDYEMTIGIKRLAWEQDDLKEKEILFEGSTVDGYGVWLKADRPEGIPSLKISVQRQDDMGAYFLSYDGKNGTPKIEYINLKED